MGWNPCYITVRSHPVSFCSVMSAMKTILVCTILCCLSGVVVSEMINVKAVFPSKAAVQGSSRLVLTRSLPEMKEITLCHWITSSGPLKENGSFTVSYATGKSPDEFLVGFEPTTKVNEVILRVSVRDEQANLETTHFTLGNWHHVCVTWSSGNGRVSGYIDGKSVGSVDKIRQGESIRWRGNLVLGQDQDIFNGNFDVDEAWEGAITDVQIWDQIISNENIASMAQCVTHMDGNIVAWLRTPFRALNGVILSEVNLCKKQKVNCN